MIRIIDGWEINEGDNVATFVEDRAVKAWIEGEVLFISDGTQYYPSGDYQISLDVLRELTPVLK